MQQTARAITDNPDDEFRMTANLFRNLEANCALKAKLAEGFAKGTVKAVAAKRKR